MVEESRSRITLDEEIEGDRDGTSDFVFCRIGSSVPLKRSDSSFGLEKPPARPLAVSERFGLLFLAHTAGFLVVKTIDAIKLAKDIKEIEEGNGNKKETEKLCVQEKSILDAQIGDVHILAVSTDSSFLAAAIGSEVRIFSVPSLIKKNQEPVFTCSVEESGRIKDFLWRKNMENSFIVLSNCGRLYHGNLENHLKDIMDGVEAESWGSKGQWRQAFTPICSIKVSDLTHTLVGSD
uniref:CTP synthase n=1 Tax=Anthurium amnicola TaxID=1678845 RepID=A0A1D1Y2Q7_9ARAE